MPISFLKSFCCNRHRILDYPIRVGRLRAIFDADLLFEVFLL